MSSSLWEVAPGLQEARRARSCNRSGTTRLGLALVERTCAGKPHLARPDLDWLFTTERHVRNTTFLLHVICMIVFMCRPDTQTPTAIACDARHTTERLSKAQLLDVALSLCSHAAADELV